MNSLQKIEPWPRVSYDEPGPFVLSEDPADHGLSEAEIACIRTAYEIRRREVRAALEAPVPYVLDWSLSGIGRPKGLKQWAAMVFVMPVIYVLFAIAGLVIVPYEYVTHRRDVRRQKEILREELDGLERSPLLRPITEKTLWRLWQVYGFERGRFEESVSVELASAWMERLYGPETLRAVQLAERLGQVMRRRAEFREQHPEIGCVLYVARLEQVLKELSGELPPYDWGSDESGPTAGERVH